MKKILFFLSAIVLLGCSSDSDNGSDDDDPVAACGTVQLSSVNQDFETLTFVWQSQGNFNYFEIGYDATTNIDPSAVNNPEIGFTFSNSFISTNLSSDEDVADPAELNFYAQENMTISFYIRAQCSNGAFTDWQGPVIVDIDEFCIKPYDLNVFADELSWDYDGFITDPSFYQIEYGLQGFTLGTGTQLNSNNQSFSGLALVQGNIYDFYVRAFCDNNLGFGDWSGPVSYFAEQDFNLCNPPSNVTRFIEFVSGNTGAVRFEWDYNGESLFEHVLVGNNGDPDSGTISTSDTFGWPVYTGLSVFIDYDFYIRAVCSDGTRTEWVGPLDVNL